MITYEDVVNNLPESIPFNIDLYMCGSLIYQGYSLKDADFIIIEKVEENIKIKLTQYLINNLKCRVHIMDNRELLDYTKKIYENGKKII